MGCGIKRCRDLVHAGGDDLSILHYHRSKGTAFTVRDILFRELNRFMDEFVSVHPCSPVIEVQLIFLASAYIPDMSPVRIENKK
jgi:hypothetical protein